MRRPPGERSRVACGEERFREELLRLTAELRPQVARLKTAGAERGEVEGSSYSVIEEELRQLREAVAAGRTVRRIVHRFNDLLVGIRWQAQGLKHGSSPGDEIHEAAEAVSDAARTIMELLEQWRGSARDALVGGDPVDVHGVTHIQPFVDETIRTFDLMLGVAVSKVGEEKKEGAESVHDLSGVVGISGSATGGVVLSLPEDTACKIVSRLLCKEVDEVNPDVEDVVAELVNVISARAKRALSRQGLPDLRCALPNVVVGKGRTVWLARELPCVSIGLVTEEFGPFCVEVSIHPTEERQALQAAVAEDAGRYGPGAATSGADAGEGRAAMKILLVDDSAILRKFVASAMDEIDCISIELIEATTGPEALAAIEEHGSSIDLILCDLGIPEIDGLAVLEKVKGATDARDACFVIISGDMSDETVAKALKGGAAGLLVKPFSRDELTRLVREVNSRSARGMPAATGNGLPLFGPESDTSGEPSSDDGPPQDEKS